MRKLIIKLETVTTVGLDLAKNVMQVHAVDAAGNLVVNRPIRRGKLLAFFGELPKCLVGMEACASAHYWAREIAALGHEVRLMPPAYVKAYVRRSKNDKIDAAACCEAVTRPSMRFVALRTVENQAELMRHRARELLAGQRVSLLNALRGHLGEIGIVAPQGGPHAYRLKRLAESGADEDGVVVVPDCVRAALRPLLRQIDAVDAEIAAIDATIKENVKADETAKRLMTIPGVGPIIASAVVATVRNVEAFANGREFAASLGLTPRQHSSGGKDRLGRISKMGDRYLRKLLVVGANAALVHAKGHDDALRRWAKDLMARKNGPGGRKLAAVALANKLARILFALLATGGVYQMRPAAA
jgi:transposase